MTDDDAQAAADLWDHANAMEGKMRDIAKRVKQASAVLANHTDGNWKDGARHLNEMGKTAKRSQNGVKKLLSLTANVVKKPQATDIGDFVKQLKKSDKEISLFDKAVSSFIIWRRKESKKIQMELSHTDYDIIATIKYIDMYMTYRSIFSRNLQTFQKRARI